jgi:hypothetical protein
MLRAELGYGVTENFKLAISGPAVFTSRTIAAGARFGLHADGRRFRSAGAYGVFTRQDLDVGKRFESTAIVGLLEPGPQRAAGSRPRILHRGGDRPCVAIDLRMARERLSALTATEVES